VSKRSTTVRRAVRGLGLPYGVESSINAAWAKRQRERERQSS
jgi:hypothetical protein